MYKEAVKAINRTIINYGLAGIATIYLGGGALSYRVIKSSDRINEFRSTSQMALYDTKRER